MGVIRDRVKNNFPMVLLTLLSIVQALALELLWGQIHEHAEFYVMSLEAVTGWIRVTANLVGIILIWLVYATNSMRFRWVPSTMDSIFPFVIGVLEFIMIDNLAGQDLGSWLVALAAIFALMTCVSQLDLKRARQDGENAEYFESVNPAKFKDFLPSVLTVMALAGSGLIVWQHGETGWFGRIASGIALLALIVQMYRTDFFWKRSMRLGSQ